VNKLRVICTPIKYAYSNLAAYFDGISHDAVGDFLVRGRTTIHNLWQSENPH
jgi:hypothetical protein